MKSFNFLESNFVIKVNETLEDKMEVGGDVVKNFNELESALNLSLIHI